MGLNKDAMMKEIEEYFENTPKEEIIKDLIDAVGGKKNFDEVFERVCQ